MTVQTFLMACHHAEIANAWLTFELVAEQPCGIFHEDRICGVEFGKGLFILALDHHLRLCRNSGLTERHDIFEPQAILANSLHRNPRDRTLGMGGCQLVSRGAGML